MTTNHIDQMRAWWDEATPGIPNAGDTYIEDERHRGSSFRIVAAATDHKYGFDNIRILDRAPKPAWHDAVAVMARCSNAPEGHREPFIRSTIRNKEHILNTHIDTLAEWYADAERITDTNLPRIGDTLIFPYNAGGYAIGVEEDDWTPGDVAPGESARILYRAPIPKPAWHDAVAVVIARIERREVYVSMPGLGTWVNPLNDHELSTTIIEKYDPTPLIEAKVTDEMVKRAIDRAEARGYIERVFGEIDGIDQDAMAEIVAAALGLETA